MSQWIDLSLQLNEATLPYPGDETLKIKWKKTLDEDGYNLSYVSSTMHLGTHIDFKSHVLNVENDHDIQTFIGNANVLFIEPKNNLIKTSDLRLAYQYIEHKEKMLLLCLDRQSLVNTSDYYHQPKFERSIFGFLKENDIHLLGADMASFEYLEEEYLDMHQDCLSHNIFLLENVMHMDKLSSHIELIVLPLPIAGLEASLVRPIARNI